MIFVCLRRVFGDGFELRFIDFLEVRWEFVVWWWDFEMIGVEGFVLEWEFYISCFGFC